MSSSEVHFNKTTWWAGAMRGAMAEEVLETAPALWHCQHPCLGFVLPARGEFIAFVWGCYSEACLCLQNPLIPLSNLLSLCPRPCYSTFSHAKLRALLVGVESLERAGTSLPMSVDMVFSICREHFSGLYILYLDQNSLSCCLLRHLEFASGSGATE